LIPHDTFDKNEEGGGGGGSQVFDVFAIVDFRCDDTTCLLLTLPLANSWSNLIDLPNVVVVGGEDDNDEDDGEDKGVGDEEGIEDESADEQDVAHINNGNDADEEVVVVGGGGGGGGG